MARSVSATAVVSIVVIALALVGGATTASAAWFNGTAARTAQNQRRNSAGVVLGFDTLADSFPPAPASSEAAVSDAQDCIALDGNSLRNGWTVKDTLGAAVRDSKARKTTR